MIRLAMEIPTTYLSEWTSCTELDFVLAHRVLEDAAYAKHFANRPIDRELILDNSMHELGTPLSIPEILRAARLVHATYVIPPDRLGDPEFTESQFWAMCTLNRGEFKLAPVVAGRNEFERKDYLNSVAERAAMICLPYREPRLTWYTELVPIFDEFERIHLLGVNTLSELQTFAEISRGHPDGRWSVDTAKAVKWGIELRSLSDGQSLRNAPTTSKDLLGLQRLTQKQEDCVRTNISFLRSHL